MSEDNNIIFKYWVQGFLTPEDSNNIFRRIRDIYPDGLINSDGLERCNISENMNIATITKHIYLNDNNIIKELTCERIERNINGEIFKSILLFPTSLVVSSQGQ